MTTTIVFYAQFIGSKVGVNSLAPTVDVERVTRSDGTRSALVTGGSATAVSRRGLYYYVLSGADLLTYDYVATFITTDASVDQQELAAMWTEWSNPHSAELANLDATITSRLASSSYVAPSNADPLTNNVPGSYLSGTAGDALGKIGTGRIYTTSPVMQSGAVETVQGDNYLNAHGRRIEWVDANNQWPVLTGATIVVSIGGVVEFTGVVITATGTTKKVGVELTSAQTASIPANTFPGHDFQVRAIIAGGVSATLVATNKPGNENAKWTSVEKIEVGT